MKPGDPMTPQQFGEMFFRTIPTPRRIGPIIHKMLEKVMKTQVDSPVGKVDCLVEMRAPGVTLVGFAHLRVDLRMHLTLRYERGPINERIEGDVVAPFYFRGEARFPLTMVLNHRPVQPGEVQINVTSNTGLAGLLNQFNQIKPAMADGIAKQINQKLAQSASATTVDVLREVNKSFPEQTAAQVTAGGAAESVDTGDAFEELEAVEGPVPTDHWVTAS